MVILMEVKIPEGQVYQQARKLKMRLMNKGMLLKKQWMKE